MGEPPRRRTASRRRRVIGRRVESAAQFRSTCQSGRQPVDPRRRQFEKNELSLRIILPLFESITEPDRVRVYVYESRAVGKYTFLFSPPVSHLIRLFP